MKPFQKRTTNIVVSKSLFFVYLILSGYFSNSQCVTTYPYSEGFEIAPTWTAAGANSDWAWGTPAHPTINTAGGGIRSWCIGGLTGSFYALSQQATLSSPCFNFSTLNYPWISLKIFWECERQWDGMILQSSINNGVTWQNVGAFGDPNDCNTANWYNYGNITWLTSLPAGTRHGWSGRIGATAGSCTGGFGSGLSGGWLTATHCLVGLANQPNVKFRFLFGSGTTCNNYDGIAIDDIYIYNGIPHAPNFSVTCTGSGNFNFTAITPPCPTVSSYTWNFGDPGSGPSNISSLANPTHVFSAPGTYSISLTTAGGGCNPPATITQTLSVNSFTPPPITQSITCFGLNNGSGTVSAIGTGPFTYTWLPTGGNSTTASNLTVGNYSVQIKDPNNCVITKTLSIIQPSVLIAPVTASNVLCNGGATGSTTVTAGGGTPGYTYTWSPIGGNSATATNLTTGSYTVLVKDANNCTITAVTNITQPTVLTTAITSNSILCNGASNGSATVTVGGGTPGYTYTWSPSGGNASTASGLIAGTYTVLVKDANNCTVTAVTNITQPTTITAAATSGSILCNGGTTSATVTAGGGTPGYTYTWSPIGGNSATASGLGVGTYTVLVKDANNCTVTAVTNITQPPALTAAISSSSILCNGGTGSSTVTAGGGTPGYTYTWSPSGGNSSVTSGLGVGTYTVLIKDINNCTVTAVTNISQPVALTAIVTSNSITCNATANGSATVTVGGGTPAYTYTWSPTGGNATSATGLGVGTYTVLVRDANNCTVTAVTNIIQPTALTAAVTSNSISCNGASNGSATVAAGGGTPGYTYTWSPSGGNTSSANGLGVGTYTVLVKDANNCTITAVTNIIQPAALTAAVTSNSVLCNGASNGNATVIAGGGTPGYTYTWSPTGGNASIASGLIAGTYTVLIKDANNCTVTAVTNITQPSALTSAVTSGSILCNGGTTGATVTVGGGTPGYTYSWSPSGGTGATAIGLSLGTYTVLVTDANNCTVTAITSNITQPPLLTSVTSASNATCGMSNGSATVTAGGGSPGYTYSWSPTGGTASIASGLSAGNYTVLVMDINNCTITAVANVNQPVSMSVTINTSSVLCNGGNNGSATVAVSGGTTPYSYTWSPAPGGGQGTANVTGLTAQNYTINISDNFGCSTVAIASISQPPALSSAITTGSILCNGGTTGATVTVGGGTPGYTYTWSPSGGNSANASGLLAGTYTVLVIDANNCTITAVSPAITQPTALTAIVTSNSITCNGAANGSATVTAGGGTPGYTYTWSPSGGNSASASNLTIGAYTVLVSDANNCTVTAVSPTITQPTALTAIVTSNNITCNGAANGSATVTVGGGTPGYTYTWSPSGGNSAIANNLTVGSYTILVSDANNCTVTAVSPTITQPTALTAIVTSNSITCNGAANGSATVATSGGTPGYTYTWSPSGGNSATAVNLTVSSYTILISDANNCTLTAVANIAQPPVLTAAVNSNTVLCNGGSTGGATVNVTGGTGAYTYTWSPTGGNSTTAGNLIAGSYTVIVSDVNNCTVTAVANISQPIAITTTINSTAATCGMANGSATVNVSGGNPGYTYTWSPSGGNASTAGSLGAGNYTVLVTDANNCVAVATITINQPSIITPTISFTNVSCFGGTNGTSAILASGGTGPFNYTWTPSPGAGQGSNSVSGLSSQNYTVLITDALGCFTTAIANITQPAALTVTNIPANVSCNGGANGSVTVSATGGTGAYTYNWTPLGGTASVATGLAAGTYTVIVTDANSCTVAATSNITEPTVITTTISSTNLTCNGAANGSAIVTAGGGTPGYTYTWSPSGGNTASVNGLTANTYTVSIKDLNNCLTATVITITQPVALTAITTQTNITCFGANNGSGSVQVNGGTSPYTYSWSPGANTTSTVNNLTIGSHTCFISDNNNCATSIVINITQPALLVASTSNYSICSNTPANITSSVAGGVAPYTFNWNGGLFTGQTFTDNPIANTIYTLVVTDNNGCNSPAVSSSVSVFTQPTVSINGNDSICFGGSTVLNANVMGATGNVNYLWIPGSFTTSVITVTPTTNAVYIVNITASGLCPLNTQKQVTVVVHPNPVVSSINSGVTGCAPLCVTFTDNSSTAQGTITAWGWSFNNGQGSTSSKPTICFNTPGTYTGDHTAVNSFGCSTTIKDFVTITVYPKPVADFNHSPIKPIINIDGEVVFTDASWGAPIISWNWYFMNTAQYTSTIQNPTFAYTEAGTYVVALIVKSDKGCLDTLLRPLVVGEDFGLYVPNAFTPNEDGINDGFQPKGFGIVKYDLYVFDRWGEKLFHTKIFEEAWDGTYQGRGRAICEEGVYTWLIEATDVFGKSHELTGHVSLIK